MKYHDHLEDMDVDLDPEEIKTRLKLKKLSYSQMFQGADDLLEDDALFWTERLLLRLVRHLAGVRMQQVGEVLPLNGVETPVTVPPPTPPPGYPIPLRAGKDLSIEAVLLNPAGQVQWDGQVYDSPSRAAKAVKGVTAVNGWKFWRYQQPETGKWEFIKALQNG